MGKLFSAPKAPQLPSLPPIIDTSSTILNTTTDAGDPPTGSGGGDDDTTEITPDQKRVQDILTRNRGRVGTITTSFNGVLSDAIANVPARKTLLGE
jgi:hypothetical protein